MSYVRAVARSVFAIDWSKRRGWSAVRRGGIVLTSLVVMTTLYGPDIGALASVAALYVGLQDRAADPPGYTVRIMGLQSILLTVVVLVSGLAGNAWVTSVILVVAAAISGLTARRDKAVSRLFADLIAVLAFLGLSSVTLEYGLNAATAVLGATLLQTAATLLSARLASDLPERRPVAAALVAVAAHLDDAQTRSLQRTGEAAADAIQKADASVARSDLSHDRRRALRKIIGDAEMLRAQASALRARLAFGAAPVTDPDVDAAVANASAALRAAATALSVDDTTAGMLARRSVSIETLREAHRTAATILATEDLHPLARNLASTTKRLIRHLRHLRDSSVTRSVDRRSRVRTAMIEDLGAPRPVDIRAGIRLALAASLGLAVAHLLGVSHGGWIAATTVALLRPDHRALTSDTVARSVGTALGALLVIPLVLILPETAVTNALMVGILAYLTYSITSANEGLYIVAITVQTVYTRAMVGENPNLVALERVTAVLIGCAIAVALLLLVPLRHGRRLRHEVATYARTSAVWIDTLSDVADGTRKPKKIRKQQREVVTARATVQHAIDNRVLEPLGPGMRPWLAHNLYTLIHDTDRAAGAAEVYLLDPATTAADRAAMIASTQHIAANLRAVADLLTGTETHSDIPPQVFAASPAERIYELDSADDAPHLLAIAERESGAALMLARDSHAPRPV